jgi:hypothetical protein
MYIEIVRSLQERKSIKIILKNNLTKHMKAKLEFDLSDLDDRDAHLRCIKSTDMALVLWEMCVNARKRITQSEDKPNEWYEGVDSVFDYFRDLLNEHDINPENLIR